MKKNKRKKLHNLSPPVQQVRKIENSMRGLVQAARVSYTRRLITPAKAMARINEQVRSLENGIDKISHHQRATAPHIAEQVPQRRTPYKRQLLRQVLPAQVRSLYEDARRALVCASRANRREVLFALRRTGKNGHGNRKAVWTALSHVSCKKRG